MTVTETKESLGELAQRLRTGAQTAMRCMLAGNERQINVGLAAMEDVKDPLVAAMRVVVSEEVAQGVKNGAGVGCARRWMELAKALEDAEAAGPEAVTKVEEALGPDLLRELPKIATTLTALWRDDDCGC